MASVCRGCVYAVVFLFFCWVCAVGCRSYFCLIKNTLAKAVSIQQVVKDVKKADIAARLSLVLRW